MQCWPKQKSTTNVQNTVLKRRTWASLLVIGANAGLQKGKQEDAVNNSELAASSTLRETDKATMSNLFGAVALFCHIFIVNFKNSVKEHELAVGENLTRKI